ncbi:ryncolin-1-like [Asterias rubens]|uniref:ryncolin-1-like n=1 Tax=Asterias rubens TaxID=7604 RepID=UPI00145572A0|nr:ryncolin-1-like [Asterias rubens]
MEVLKFFFLFLMVQACQGENQQRFIETFYLVENRALLNHGFQIKTVSSPVICGRDCSMDPQCVSFNYQTDTKVCEFNSITRESSPDDFIESQGSVYYDNKVDTLSFAIPNKKYSSCLKLYQAGYRDNGVYKIYPTSLTDGFKVYCDMETDGGGWIVFQRRQDGTVDFYRTWADYQSGFGDLQNEFWLGNDILRNLTESGQWELRVDMEEWELITKWASYGEFAVTGDKYTLHVGSYDAQSTASNQMPYHSGCPFSTKDKENDSNQSDNCAVQFEGAWWFNDCFWAHLNGKYYQEKEETNIQGIQWGKTAEGNYYSLMKCSMKIRQVVE